MDISISSSKLQLQCGKVDIIRVTERLEMRITAPTPTSSTDSAVISNCTGIHPTFRPQLPVWSAHSLQRSSAGTPSTPMGQRATLLFSNQPGMFPPQGLCMCFSLHSECLLPQYLHDFLLCSLSLHLNKNLKGFL